MFRFRHGELRGPANGSHFEQAHRGEEQPDERRRGFPERGQRAHHSDRIGVKDAFVPPPGTARMIGIFAHHIEQGLEYANHEWLGVLGHEQDVATTLLAHFVDKLRKAFRVRQIYDGAGLHSVAVAPADHHLVPLFREIQDRPILFPAPHTAQFETMKQVAELGDKIGERAPFDLCRALQQRVNLVR